MSALESIGAAVAGVDGELLEFCGSVTPVTALNALFNCAGIVVHALNKAMEAPAERMGRKRTSNKSKLLLENALNYFLN
jgi:hypothetical protein